MIMPVLPVVCPAMSPATQASITLRPIVYKIPAAQLPHTDTVQTFFDNGVPVMVFIWLFTVYVIFKD